MDSSLNGSQPLNSPLDISIHLRRDEHSLEDGQQVRHAAELVFTQDALGKYLSFYWAKADQFKVDPNKIVGTQMSETCGPISLSRYLSQVRWVFDHLKPHQFRETFYYGGQYLDFDLTLSPILLPQNPVRTLLILGKSITPCRETFTIDDRLSPRQPIVNEERLAHYQQLFSQIAWNIRRTLDLETIWQQTVNGLGNLLNLDCCLICDHDRDSRQLTVVADYQSQSIDSLRGKVFQFCETDGHPPSLAHLYPLEVILPSGVALNHFRLLGILTSYQDQANALILMVHGSLSAEDLSEPVALRIASPENLMPNFWSGEEQFLVRELADQVGTAIAHANLYTEAHSLADELQSANLNLIRKHLEVEEARKQAEEASRLKSDFLANTSHELRTPLNSMIGFLNLLLDDMADTKEEADQFLREAHQSALLLLAIINDILDVAKLEANSLELELHPLSLAEIFADVERKTSTQALQKGLTFEVVLPSTRDGVMLYSDYQRLLQILLNLVGNAIKFTDEGGIILRAKVKRQRMTIQNQTLPGYAQISVEDTGIGVPLEKQIRLFQAFSQVDSGRTRKYGGTGLGLVISQKLIEAMHGTINFFSLGEGLGATVTITVPLFQDPGVITVTTASLDEEENPAGEITSVD